MILTINGKTPEIEGAAFIAPNATLAGDISIAAGSSVWYGAVLRADTGAIRIGQYSNVQDLACLHTGPGQDVSLGRNVTVGHCALVHGCTVEDNVLIGMHSTIMNGCIIGAGSVIAAGAVIPQNTVIPPRSLVVGVPGKVVKTVSEEQSAHNLANAEEYVILSAEHANANP